jgi:hypothetical protein
MWPVYKLFDTGGAGTIDVKEFVRGLASYHARPSSKIQAQARAPPRPAPPAGVDGPAGGWRAGVDGLAPPPPSYRSAYRTPYRSPNHSSGG